MLKYSVKSMQLPQLDYMKEFEEIEKAVDESGITIQYLKMVATLENFSDILIRNPYVLHFSGHGVKNSPEFLGNSASLYKGEGDMLVFEDQCCDGVIMSEVKLTSILEKCNTNIKAVVVLSCHSELIGNIFHNAGIKHVICIAE